MEFDPSLILSSPGDHVLGYTWQVENWRGEKTTAIATWDKNRGEVNSLMIHDGLAASRRELDVLAYSYARSLTRKQVVVVLNITPQTLNNHIHNILLRNAKEFHRLQQLPIKPIGMKAVSFMGFKWLQAGLLSEETLKNMDQIIAYLRIVSETGRMSATKL